MGRDDKRTLAPRLRFPDFRDAPEWEKYSLGDLCRFVRGPFGGALKKDIFVPKGYAVYEQSHVIDNQMRNFRYFITKDKYDEMKRFAVQPRDIIMSCSGTMGKFAQLPEGPVPGVINQALLKLTVKKECAAEFILVVLGLPATQLKLLSQSAGGAIKNVVGVLQLKEIEVPLPSGAEQQKIADCLTSLDELIAAQGLKVEATKAHKKGLMQRLFPREGETLPRLRFPEFRDAPECSAGYSGYAVTLGEVVEVASGQVDPTKPPYCDLPHVGGENIESHTGNLQGVTTARERQLISGKYLFDERHVLYSKIRPALNKVAIPDFKGICSADIYPLRPSNDQLCRQYLAYLLLSEGFLEYATKHSGRSKIPKINRDVLLAYKSQIPVLAEQQRIADCLTTLDTQIAAEADKLAVLKTHKRGLMQQLFPLPEGD